MSAAHGNPPAICSLHGALRVRNAPGLRLPFGLEILELSSQRIWLRPISSRHVWPVEQFATCQGTALGEVTSENLGILGQEIRTKKQ